MRDDGRVRVLHVAGWAFSGTTLLANVVANSGRGLFAAGELRLIWSRSLRRDHLCGCGVPFRDCPVWAAVVRRAFGSPEAVDAERLEALDRRLLHNWRAPWYLGRRPAGLRLRKELDEYGAALASLYEAVRAVTGCEVIVDTSKPPLWALLLSALPELDVSVLHVVRDPRAYLHSRRRRVREGRAVDDPGDLLGLALWETNHVALELAGRTFLRGRYALLRYEDFARRPRAAARTALALAGADEVVDAWSAANRIDRAPNHVVAGNHRRFESGPVEIELDDEWRTQLPPSARALAAATTWPLLLRHGYLGGGPARGSEEAEEGALGLVHEPR